MNPYLQGNPYAALNPYGGMGTAMAQPQHGILSGLIQETKADLVGTAKTAAALTFLPFDLFGANVPITFDDLTTRDKRGAAMMVATVAGGWLGRPTAALGSRMMQVGKAGSWMDRTARMSQSEALTGFIYGTLRSGTGLNDPGESALGAITGDTLRFGAFGAGFGLASSAAKATLGATRAASASAKSRFALSQAMEAAATQSQMQEFAGLRLANRASGTNVAIARLPQTGEVSMTFFAADGSYAKAETVGSNFAEALAKARDKGYTDAVGPLLRQATDEIKEVADDKTRAALAAVDDDLQRAFGELDVTQYTAAADALRAAREANTEMTALAADVLMPTNEFGVPILDAAMKRRLGPLAGIPEAQAIKMDAPDLVRELAKKGVLDVESLANGRKMEDVAFQLEVNGLVPTGAAYVSSPSLDAWGLMWRTPARVAAMFPQLASAVENAKKRMQALQVFQGYHNQALHEMRVTWGEASPQVVQDAVRILDEAAAGPQKPQPGDFLRGVPRSDPLRPQYEAEYQRALGEWQSTVETWSWDAAANQARGLAASHPRREVIEAVEKMIEVLSDVRERRIAAGIPGADAFTSFFPVVNASSWSVRIRRRVNEVDKDGNLKPREIIDREDFDTQAEAVQYLKAQQAKAEASGGLETISSGAVLPRSLHWDIDHLKGKTAEEIADIQKAFMDEATANAEGGFVNPRGWLAKSRSFTRSPLETLQTYLGTAEREIQFAGFDEEIAAAKAALLPNQRNLQLWTQRFGDDMMGRPHTSERVFQRAIEGVAGVAREMGIDWRPPDRALARYSAAIRGWESFSRLGGPLSGIVNLTQIAVNTFPVLGARWTYEGLRLMSEPGAMKRALKELNDAGVDLQLYLPLTEAGTGTLRDRSSKALLKEAAVLPLGKEKLARYGGVVNNLALAAFNKSEEINKVVTGWGAYKKALSEGRDKTAAAAYAKQIVEKTQFDYSLANTPEALRGPIRSVLFQFKNYLINEIEFVASLRGKELVRFLGALQALGGLSVMFNLPGTELVDMASASFFDREISEAVKVGAGDDWAGRFVAFGGPGPAGIDLSDNIGIGAVREVTKGFFGPAKDDAVALFEFGRDATADLAAFGRVSDSTKNRTLQRVMPSAMRRLSRAHDVVATGDVRNPYTGKLVYRPEDRYATAAQMAIGFSPIEVTQEREADQIVKRARERYIRGRLGFANEAAMAALRGDAATVHRTLAEAKRHGYQIDERTLQARMKELSKDAKERRARMTPVQLREHYSALFETTGTVDL